MDCEDKFNDVNLEKLNSAVGYNESSGCGSVCAKFDGSGLKMLALDERNNTVNFCDDKALILAAGSNYMSQFGSICMWIIFLVLLVVDVLNMTGVYIVLMIIFCKMTIRM